MGSFFKVQWFLDKPAVIRAVDRAAKQVLNRFGAYVRATARQSIRAPRRMQPGEMAVGQRARWHQRGKPAEYAPSAPGEAPRSRTGKLKHSILFWVDLGERSVTIGPASGRRGDTPGVIEHGGRILAGRARGQYMLDRPYMGPALMRELPKLVPMWRDSVKA